MTRSRSLSLWRLAAAAALPAVAFATGADNSNSTVHEPGVLRFPIVPVGIDGANLIGKHAKRQQSVGTLSRMSGTLYTINIGLGSENQIVPVQFDTGSSELWVNPVCSKSTTPSFCSSLPRFTLSNTLVDLNTQGGVTYGTGYTDFNYVYDYVNLGGATITQQIFGVAYDSAHAVVGIMGAGPELSGWISPYPLPMDSLAQQGLINSRAFSLDLRGFDSPDGSVIFGGIDAGKFSGPLIKNPIIPASQSPDGFTRFWIYCAGISVNQPDGTVAEVYTKPAGGKGQPFLLDSGYTLSALPTALFNKLVAAFPSAVYVPSADLYLVDCQDPGEGGSIDFLFGEGTINVRYYDFIWHYPDSDLCVLGAFEDSFPVLGDTFLRSAYAVYDWDNRNIHLAQSSTCNTNIIPIGQGANAVPSITGDCPAQNAPQPSASSSVPPAASSSVPPVVSSSVAPIISSSVPPVSSTPSVAPSLPHLSSSVPVSSSAPSVAPSLPHPSSSVPTSSSAPPVVSSSAPPLAPPLPQPSSSLPVSSSTEEDYCFEESETSYIPSSTTSSSVPASSTPPTIPSSSIPPTVPSSVPAAPSISSSTLPSISLSASSVSSTWVPSSSGSSTWSVHPSSGSSWSATPPISSTWSSTGAHSSSWAWSSGSATGPWDTITRTQTQTYTITSCAPDKTACHPGHVTTEVVAVTTTVCPQTSATYGVPHTWVCSAPGHGCSVGATLTTQVPITIVPGHVGGGGGKPGWTAAEHGDGQWPRPTSAPVHVTGDDLPGGGWAPGYGGPAGHGSGWKPDAAPAPGGTHTWQPKPTGGAAGDSSPGGAPVAPGGPAPTWTTVAATAAVGTGGATNTNYGGAKSQPTDVVTAGAARMGVASVLAGVAMLVAVL